MCVQKNLEICGKNIAVNIPLQRKRKHDDSIIKSIVTTKVKLDPPKKGRVQNSIENFIFST